MMSSLFLYALFVYVLNVSSYRFGFVLVGSIVVETRGGPLVEYERRIAEGELLDGDACQVSNKKSRVNQLRVGICMLSYG